MESYLHLDDAWPAATAQSIAAVARATGAELPRELVELWQVSEEAAFRRNRFFGGEPEFVEIYLGDLASPSSAISCFEDERAVDLDEPEAGLTFAFDVFGNPVQWIARGALAGKVVFWEMDPGRHTVVAQSMAEFLARLVPDDA